MFYGATIGERLKKLRKDKGEKQQDVADDILVDRTVLSLFEGNKRKPDIKKLIALANHFDVTTDFLLCRSDVKKADTTLQAVAEYTGLSDEAIKRIVSLKNLSFKNIYLRNNIETFDDFICSDFFLKLYNR